MTECQVCTKKTDVFLCSSCSVELRAMLRSLLHGPAIDDRHTPGLLEHLGEAAIGQVRMGDGGRRNRKNRLVQYADPKPATDGCGGTIGQQRLEEDARTGRLEIASVLRTGGINPKAARLLTETHQALTGFVDALAFIGVIAPPHFAAVPRNSVPASFGMAEWLLGQMSAIALSEDAGAFHAKLDQLTRRIEQVIDRPEPPRTCGPCPTIVGHARQECATALEAKPGETEVTCPACQQTYNVETLITRTFNSLRYKNFTVRELVDTILPRVQEQVPKKTLERWIRDGWVPLRGFDAEGHQLVRLDDVRRVRAERPRHKRAG